MLFYGGSIGQLIELNSYRIQESVGQQYFADLELTIAILFMTKL
jgi:hypothetical protein